MKFPRRKFLHLAAGAAALPTVSRIARAQTTYPSRPITMIVAFPAGGPSDVVGRVLVERMRGSLGQPIIIENATGAGGSIGAGRAARARADGYTIDFGIMATHVLNGVFYSPSPLPFRIYLSGWCRGLRQNKSNFGARRRGHPQWGLRLNETHYVLRRRK